VQEPVAQLLRLGSGEVTVQGLGPGEQVDAGQVEVQPGLVDREDPRREPAEAVGLAAANPVFKERCLLHR
jgi:flagella basal body P-ring formation protein FlgA